MSQAVGIPSLAKDDLALWHAWLPHLLPLSYRLLNLTECRGLGSAQLAQVLPKLTNLQRLVLDGINPEVRKCCHQKLRSTWAPPELT